MSVPKVGDRFDGGTVEKVEVGRWSTYVYVRPTPGLAGRWAVAERHARWQQLALFDEAS